MNGRKTVPTQQGVALQIQGTVSIVSSLTEGKEVFISTRMKHLHPKLQSSKFLLIFCHTLEAPKLRRRQLFTLKFSRLLKFCCGHVQKCLSCHGTQLTHTLAPSDPMSSAFLHLHPSRPRGRANEHSQNTERWCSVKRSSSCCCSPLPHSRALWSGLLP